MAVSLDRAKTAPYQAFRPLPSETAFAPNTSPEIDLHPTPCQPESPRTAPALFNPPSSHPYMPPPSAASLRSSPPPPSKPRTTPSSPAYPTLPPEPFSPPPPLHHFDPPTPGPKTLEQLVDALKDLAKLHQMGVLTDREFQDTKAPIIEKLRHQFRSNLHQKEEPQSELVPDLLIQLISKS